MGKRIDTMFPIIDINFLNFSLCLPFSYPDSSLRMKRLKIDDYIIGGNHHHLIVFLNGVGWLTVKAIKQQHMSVVGLFLLS